MCERLSLLLWITPVNVVDILLFSVLHSLSSGKVIELRKDTTDFNKIFINRLRFLMQQKNS